ncbi:MAG: 50S ribosomal protein L4 [Proteobacteria bacterium]|nr:50S ribosomal protein L4 [Pseudomonadota bacterium]NBY20334.1 50S ribosomal protein L4 [bacterium]
MPSLPLYDLSKKKVGNIDLNDAVFAGDIRPHLLNDAVRAQLAWKYEFKTANSRTRTEVQGTRKKVYKQKGTGQARHGDEKAPIFVGGGKAHGPKPHRRSHKINKKVMRAALVTALSLNQKEDRLFVVDKMELKKPSTKAAKDCLKAFEVKTAIFVNSGEEDAEQFFNKSVKNLNNVKFLKPEGVNVFDILKYKNIIVSSKAAKKLTERLAHV